MILGGLLALYLLAAVTSPAQTLQHAQPAAQSSVQSSAQHPIVLTPNVAKKNPSQSKTELARPNKKAPVGVALPDVLPARPIEREAARAQKQAKSDVQPMQPELNARSQAK
jgi:hypothetical protein